MASKDEAARRLVEWHFEVEPDLQEAYRIIADDEDASSEPIKLIEVNAATVPTGSIELFGFAPTDEIPFPTLIAEVTPEEFRRFRSQPETWPEGWNLKTAQQYVRSEAA